jgi:hypothetical protein
MSDLIAAASTVIVVRTRRPAGGSSKDPAYEPRRQAGLAAAAKPPHPLHLKTKAGIANYGFAREIAHGVEAHYCMRARELGNDDGMRCEQVEGLIAVAGENARPL